MVLIRLHCTSLILINTNRSSSIERSLISIPLLSNLLTALAICGYINLLSVNISFKFKISLGLVDIVYKMES